MQNLLNTDVIVFFSLGCSFKWLIYPASFSLHHLTNDAIGFSKVSGDHFDVVLSSRRYRYLTFLPISERF